VLVVPSSLYVPFCCTLFIWMLICLCKMELKIMLAHILLEYDVSYPAGVTERPKNVVFNGAIIPDTKALLVFRPR